jgi:hypothetical protein
MRKLMITITVSMVFLPTHICRRLLAQACVISTTLTPTAGQGRVFLCASPGAACSPANGGGAGRCLNGLTRNPATNSVCGCFSQGKSTTADPEVDIKALVAKFSSATRGDIFDFAFTAADLSQQHTFLFLPNLFDANPAVLSTQLTVTVDAIDREAEKDVRDNEGHERKPIALHLSIKGSEVFDAFDVNGFGSTGPNTQTFVAGRVLLDLRKLVFDGVVTSILTNDIWTAKNPIVLAEAWRGSLEPKTNSVSFETTAPDDAFIIPAANLLQASSVPAGDVFWFKPVTNEPTGVERANMEWLEQVRRK